MPWRLAVTGLLLLLVVPCFIEKICGFFCLFCFLFLLESSFSIGTDVSRHSQKSYDIM